MVDVQSAALGGVAFLLMLFILYWVILKTTSLGDDDHDTEGTEDRLSMDNERHRRVGFRYRVSRQTPMTKAFIGSIIVLIVYLAIAIYQFAATGTPNQIVYADYVEQGLFGMICVGGGIWFKAKQDAKAGEIQIMKEQDEGNSRTVIRFDRSGTRETDDGTTLVPELKDTQVFGLFWRPRLIADDPNRRDADHRLPDDLVMYEVPNDESAVWDQRTGEVTVRAKKVDEVDNPNRPADYEIVPSERKSRSEIDDLENEISELEKELHGEKIEKAILSENLTQIEEILTNEEYDSLERIRKSRDALKEDEPLQQRHYDDRPRDRERERGRERPPASSN